MRMQCICINSAYEEFRTYARPGQYRPPFHELLRRLCLSLMSPCQAECCLCSGSRLLFPDVLVDELLFVQYVLRYMFGTSDLTKAALRTFRR